MIYFSGRMLVFFKWMSLFATITWLTQIGSCHALVKLTDGLTLCVEKYVNLFSSREIGMPRSTDPLEQSVTTRRYWLHWTLTLSVPMQSCQCTPYSKWDVVI